MRRVLYFLFFLSGVSMLVYEVAWQRMLGTVLGNTTTATATILTIFFGGIAAGSLFFARSVPRLSPKTALLRYAALEAGIGAWAFMTPWLLNSVMVLQNSLSRDSDLRNLSGFQAPAFLLSALFLFLPTFLIGGTFPLMDRAAGGEGNAESNHSAALYGINALGGFAGAVLAPFCFIDQFGVKGSVFFGALINLFIATIAWRQSKRPFLQIQQESAKKRTAKNSPDPASPPNTRVNTLYGLLCGFGVFFLGLEVLWVRSLVLVIGSAIYSFALILANVLLGIAVGGLLCAAIVKKTKEPLRLFFALTVALSLSIAAPTVFFDKLPSAYANILGANLGKFGSLQLKTFFFVSLLVFPPSLISGMLFPLGVRGIYIQGGWDAARPFGRAFGMNTIGGVAGPLVGGMILMPTIGIQRTILFFALAYALSALVGSLVFSRRILTTAGSAMTAACLLLALIFVPPWSRESLTSGVFMYGRGFLDNPEMYKTIFYKESGEGVVTVKQRSADGALALAVNGKILATGREDLGTEILLGHLPVFLHSSPHEALVIGVGSAITTGSILAHPEIEHVDQVEIEPAVVEAARLFLEDNYDAFSDPRLSTIIGDARLYLLRTRKTYDVITSEPSNPWISGMAALFTADFFRLAKGRLAPGGVMMQWMHYYDMVPEDVAMVIETFRSVFPRTTVWMNPMAADIFLIGSEEALALDARDLDRKFSPEAVRKSLARADIIEPADIFRTFVLDEEAAGKIAAGAKIHSDDRPYLEFRAPRALHSRTTWRNVEIFLSLLSDPLPLFSPPPPPHFMGRLLGNLNGRKEALERIGFLFRHR